MRAAVLHEHGSAPRCEEFPDPEPGPGEVLVEVDAAALHHLDLHKASGTFYTGPPPLPSVVGTDGVGRAPGGRRVYFDVTRAPYGSMAELCPVAEDDLIELPNVLDPALAAALGNTGLGGWLAVTWRSGLEPGETVVVLGAGAVAMMAVQAARIGGARRIVAVALAEDRHEALRVRGAHEVIALDRVDDLAAAIQEATGGVDVTIDTLWGEPALAAMQAANRFARHVEVGNLAGAEIALPAPLIRSLSLDVRGFSVAHPPLELRRDAFAQLCRHVADGEIVMDVERVPLADVDTAWERQRSAAGGPKLVLVP
jgi:NADPH2:quinone reductase